MSELEFVAALMDLQRINPEGYNLVVETVHKLHEKQLEKEEAK